MQSQQLQLQKQILLTLSYSLVFSKPLTEEEIVIRLMYSKEGKKAHEPDNIRLTIFNLGVQKKLKKQGEYWQLNRSEKDLVMIRKKRERLSSLKIKELQPFINFAKIIGWISGVAVTGSVSVQNAEAKDDVDLMIVTRPNRLWLVRPLLVVFSFLQGKRRSWNHEEYNSWCLNLWLEETALQVHRDKRSIYTAYEVCQAQWLLSKNDAESKFLLANQWSAKLLPHYYSDKLDTVHNEKPHSLVKKQSSVLNILNTFAYKLQRWYMQRHMTRESVSLSYAFFHPRDTKRSIFQDWKNIILQIR